MIWAEMRPIDRLARYVTKSSASPNVKNGGCDLEMRRRSIKFSGGTHAGSLEKTAKGTASQSLTVRPSCTGRMLTALVELAISSIAQRISIRSRSARTFGRMESNRTATASGHGNRIRDERAPALAPHGARRDRPSTRKAVGTVGLHSSAYRQSQGRRPRPLPPTARAARVGRRRRHERPLWRHNRLGKPEGSQGPPASSR